jgi:Ser/Thr protein kinase RdoA (MazF antagonist)
MAGNEKIHELTVVVRAALPHWGIESDSSVELLKFRENAVFAIEAPDRERYVIRLHRPGYHSDRALRSELEWITALADSGFPVPRVHRGLDGTWFAIVSDSYSNLDYRCDLLEWIEGVPLGVSENPSIERSLEEVADIYRTLGRLAARLHALSGAWSRPTDFERHSWDESGCLGASALWGSFVNLKSLTDSERNLLIRAAQLATERLRDFGKGPERYGLIHADLVPDNVLRSRDRMSVIDFDDAGFGWYVWEFVTAVFFLHDTPAYEPALTAMISGYREIRDLPAADLAILPTLTVVRGLVYLGWFCTRSETETARTLVHPITRRTLELAARLLDDA